MKNVVRLGLPALILLTFGAFTVDVWLRHGLLGLVSLVQREPWGAQVTVDVFFCAFFGGAWLYRDARRRGLPYLPYLIVLPAIGSLAFFAYVIHRGLAERSPARAASA